LIEPILNCVVQSGWLDGLYQTEVRDRLAPNKHKALIKDVKEYLNENNLVDLSYTTVASTDMHSLINSSFPHQHQSMSIITTFVNQLQDGTDDNPQRQEQEELQRRNHEMTIVAICTDRCEKWELAQLVQAGELMYISQKFDNVIDAIIQEYVRNQDFTEFINKCLTSIMYLLKRHQSIDEFTESLLFKYSQAELPLTAPKLNLRMALHILLLKSDFSLSRMIMSLLSKRNPVPFLEPSIGDGEHQFIFAIIHVWDYVNQHY
jgi:hypothetical protein